MKLLVNAPSGVQELIEIGEGGGYFDDGRILWRESDGPMPANLQASLAAAENARAKAQAWERIKAKRERLSDEGGYKVVVGGVDKWFHSDAKSKTQQLSLFVMGASVPAVQWKTMDGSFVTMTQAIAAAIFQAAAAQDMAIFAAAETHKAAMEASADPAAYDFSAGWPTTFA